MLDLSQDKTHTTDSHHTFKSDLLQNLCLKTPIASGNAIDEYGHNWMVKLVTNFICCAVLADTILLPQRAKLSIKLVEQKILLLAQIKMNSM